MLGEKLVLGDEADLGVPVVCCPVGRNALVIRGPSFNGENADLLDHDVPFEGAKDAACFETFDAERLWLASEEAFVSDCIP